MCRFNFYHEHSILVFARQPPPALFKLDDLVCPCRHHPNKCPVQPACGVIKKFLREGKSLVLPASKQLSDVSAGLHQVEPGCVWHDTFDAVVFFVGTHHRFPALLETSIEDSECVLAVW